jgi:PAS domain S-box-containing protein
MTNRPDILHIVLDASPLSIILIDPAGIVRVWNKAAESLLGWKPAEIVGRPLPVELQLPEGWESSSLIELRRKDGGTVSVELRTFRVMRDGTESTLALLAETGDSPEKRLDQLRQELDRVIAEVKQARNEAQTERRFRDLLEAAPDAIIEVDRLGRIVVVNLATEKQFGYAREELLGQGIELLVPESLREAHNRHREHYWDRAATRPMGSGIALEGRRKDGSQFPVEISLSPVVSKDGLRVTAVIRDISERKRTEDRVRAMQESYTKELELRNREVERANQLKSEFLASMSHELRTPLHTVIGFAELLSEEIEGPLNEKQKRFIDHIRKDSLHLLELINDVLDLSKIEAGRLKIHREAFDIAIAVNEVLSSIQPAAAAKSLTVETDVSVSSAILADRLRFRQILYNLLSNAVKFTPERGKITVEARLRDGFAELAVTDTGIGIPRGQHEAVFDKFYQVGATTKGVREGTGLGLAITKALVEEHGGRIWVDSEPGKGSRFTFTIAIGHRDEKSAGSGR